MALAGDGGMGLGPNRGFVPAPGLGPDYLPDKEPIWRRCQVAGSHPPAKPPSPTLLSCHLALMCETGMQNLRIVMFIESTVERV